MSGDEIFCTWVVTLNTPAEWLSTVAWKLGFSPRKDPLCMTPVEIQQAVANVLCPPRLSSQIGVSVAYRRSTSWQDGLSDSCLVVLRMSRPINLIENASDIFPTLQGVDIEPAHGTLEGIRHLLETGGRGGKTVGRILHQGLPIKANR